MPVAAAKNGSVAAKLKSSKTDSRLKDLRLKDSRKEDSRQKDSRSVGGKTSAKNAAKNFEIVAPKIATNGKVKPGAPGGVPVVSKKEIAAPTTEPLKSTPEAEKVSKKRGSKAKPSVPTPGSMSTPPIRITFKKDAEVPSKKSAKLAAIAAKALAAAAAPPPPPPSPVTTDGKPRKNLAGFSMKELEEFRALLLFKRRELVGDMSSMEGEALRSATGSNLSNLPLHMADMGTDNYEQEFTLGLVEKDRQLLREINSALAKIQDGRYGICEGTGKPIGKPRLDAAPWARFSIEHARMIERGLLRR